VYRNRLSTPAPQPPRTIGAIARGTPFLYLTSGMEDFASEMTMLYSTKSVGKNNYSDFLIFTDPKQFKKTVGVALT
jgi:hypothetical protein